jgi:signal transduction histidine kinase
MNEQTGFKRNKIRKSTENYKIVLMIVAVGSVCGLTHYCHVVLRTCSVFSQLYYIPIVLGSIWWKRKGLVVPIFLGGFLIVSHRLFHTGSPVADYLRALMFVVVGLVMTILSEQAAHAENIMATERKKLRSLARRLSIVEERQRQHIAAGLHDSVGPKLSAAKILAQTLKSKELADESGHLDKVIDWIESSIKEIRVLIFKLSPKVLYEIGLKAAVESLIESHEQESSVKFHYTYVGPTNILDHRIRSIIFRAIRELFTNIGKHAQAQNVYVKIEIDSERLNVIIEDDGIGFDVFERLKGTETIDGFGLFSIRQQLLDFDGQILVESEIGSGTKVTITCPVETAEEHVQVQEVN